MTGHQREADRPQPPGESGGDGVVLSLRLPRDAFSVPLVRRLVRHALEQVGVDDEVTSDIELALAEACTNVLDHSGPGDSYEVSVTIGPQRCELRIVDVGHGFDHNSLTPGAPVAHDLTAERGRGLGLMHALVDQIELVSAPETGTLVRLVKQLRFVEPGAARPSFPRRHRDPLPTRRPGPASAGLRAPHHRSSVTEQVPDSA